MDPQKTPYPPPVGVPEPQQPGLGFEVGDTSLTEALATLRKRRWLLILAVVLGASYGSYKAYTQPKLFQATGTIQVHNGASNEYRLDAGSDYGDDSQTKMNTEVAILKSDALLYTVAREMNLANNTDFSGRSSGARIVRWTTRTCARAWWARCRAIYRCLWCRGRR